MMSLQTIVTKEYPAELAGERIGWTSVAELSQRPDLVGIHVVVATIAEGGALYGYHRDEDGRQLTSSQTQEGFVATAGLSMLVSRETDQIVQQGTYFRAGDRGSNDGHVLRNGGSGHDAPVDDAKNWQDSTAGVLGSLKEGLARCDVAQHYGAVYYTLNGQQGHEAVRSLSELRSTAPQELFLPDSDMVRKTERQVEIADSMAISLGAVQQEDVTMQNRLTVFSDLPAADITEAFVKSRRAVRHHENTLLTASARLAAPTLVYLPIGFRPGGRTWPYMDPLARSEDESFGNELAALSMRQTEIARHELNGEMQELKKRLTFAQQGAAALRLLLQAEQAC